ncbi:hypothetical protein Ahy_A01g001937 [Arachis hypogaea]|uniref:Uncharacterized protein n=1 Tax=Arachis hypogaea TaxID=3818 RepID=A0A445EPR0_ARAHY|nr:hypothetical protein Ahy_A01g001937 [Arachis hypogaea]
MPVLLNHLHSQSQTMVRLIVAAMLTLSSCKENKLQLDVVSTIHNLSTCEEIVPLIVAFGIILLVDEICWWGNLDTGRDIEDGSSLGKEHAREIERNDSLRGSGIDGTRRTKNMARELLFLLKDYSNYSSRQKQMNRELIERIVEEIDVDGEKLADAKLRLVEEMITKLNT